MTIQLSMETESRAALNRTAYLANLLNQRAGLEGLELAEAAIAPLHQIRNAAAVRAEELAIPSNRDEEWRFTDLSSLVQTQFAGSHTLTKVHRRALTLAELDAFLLPEAQHSRLVFEGNAYAPHLSSVEGLPEGVFVGSLSQAIARYPQIWQFLAQQQGAEEVFTTLNTASFTDALVVWVPRNLDGEVPIHLLYLPLIDRDTPTLAYPRCLVIAETGSRVTLVEDYATLEEGSYFTNAVTEIWVEANAEVIHTRLQRDSQTAVHVGKTAVSQARDSRYTCHAVSMGGQLSRHHLEVYQTGEQTHTTLNGLTIAGREQVADTHSIIAFSKPHGSSRQVHRCIVDDRAHAVFNGKVTVPKAAQLTDAGQLNQSLLLSPKARVDTKPQLEIVADNVKCTHGATVSQLENDSVFYLQSRGIDQNTARQLLVYAFAYEAIEQIPIPSLQTTLSQQVRSYQQRD